MQLLKRSLQLSKVMLLLAAFGCSPKQGNNVSELQSADDKLYQHCATKDHIRSARARFERLEWAAHCGYITEEQKSRNEGYPTFLSDGEDPLDFQAPVRRRDQVASSVIPFASCAVPIGYQLAGFCPKGSREESF